MICKFCNAENEDGSLFCGNCGKRIDGKIQCPKCGEYNNENETFCSNCGARIDGKTVCECGAIVSGNFCPKCGRPAKKITYSPCSGKRAAVDRFGTEELPLWKKVLKIVGGSFVCLGALMALIFVFLTSLSVTPVINSKTVSDSHSIYYFIGKIYGDLSKTLDSSSGMADATNSAYSASLYVPAVLSTIVSLCMLICVTTFAIITIVKFVKNAINGSFETSGTISALTAASYIAGCVLLVGMQGGVSDTVFGSKEILITATLNSTTRFGLYFSSVCIAIGLICAILSGQHRGDAKNLTAKYITLFLSCGLAVAFLITAGKSYITVKSSEIDGSTASIIYVKNKESILIFASSMLSTLSKTDTSLNKPHHFSLFYCGVADVILCVAAVVIACVLISKLLSLKGDNGALEIVFSAICFALALGMFVSTIVALREGSAILEDTARDFEIGMSYAIAAFAISVVSLGISITRFAIARQAAKTEISA